LNIYDLAQTSFVVFLCRPFSKVCSTAGELFFKFKFFRFITLSPVFFVELILLFGGIWMITRDTVVCKKLRASLHADLLKTCIYAGVAFLLLQQILLVSDGLVSLSLMTWKSRSLSFADRFVPLTYGIQNQGWIWPYTRFLIAHVPQNATIFIPPQRETWAQEGNADYLRWFIYPRKTLSSTDPTAALPREVDFVIVSNGGWSGGEAGWPKIHIPESEIAQVFLKNRQTFEEKRVDARTYYKNITPDWWGVIELKH
jgi:hypothetical protein